jgi:hypothetical protein
MQKQKKKKDTKTCKHATCNGPCRRNKPTKTKRPPIRKISKKQTKKKSREGKITKKDHLMYLEIWEEREHVDFETGQLIEEAFSTLLFHHVLPKKTGIGGYPQFRHSKWNVVIVSWETHTKAESNIDLVPKIKAYRDHLLKTHL